MLDLKKIYSSIISIIYLPCFCIAQNIGCVDSITYNKFFPSYFKTNFSGVAQDYYKPKRDVENNLYLGGVTEFNSNTSYSSIIKFNSNSELIWYKNYKYDIVSSPIKFGVLTNIDEKSDLLFYGSYNNGATNTGWPQIIKIDSAGNFKLGKVIKRSDNPNIKVNSSMPFSDSGNNIFCTAQFDNDIANIAVIALDDLGNVSWSKNYSHSTLPKYHVAGMALTSQNKDALVLCIQFYYNSDNPTNSSAIHGIQLVQINKTDGSLLKQNSFSYFKDDAFTTPYIGTLRYINYNTTTGTFLIDSYGDKYANSPGLQHVYTTVNEDLNLLKTVWYKSLLNPVGGAAFNGERFNIDSENTITLGYSFTNTFYGPEMFYYTVINENLELIAQKKVNLTDLGFPNTSFVSDIDYQKNGLLNFQLVTTNNFGTNYIYLYNNSPYFKSSSTCAGLDTTYYIKNQIFLKPLLNLNIEESGSVPIETVNITMPPPVDYPLPKEELCKEISICDTIKLFGNNYHCLSNPYDSFKIMRNLLCKRITNWQVDTNYIKILSQNDTALYVQYLKAYKGSIKVGFGGCSLTDEIPIEVFAPKASLNLGNDTIYCPGKSITLHTGGGFKTYQWQDGSSLDSLVATQPGLYYVSVTDSCGNIFKDSIKINPIDVLLQLDYPKQICINDTVTFTLPAKLYNYNWMPTNTANLNNLTWRLYPSATTIYNISGERLPGCIISDTVLINVKTNCVPDYIYFPNAFTPNNDGVNDTYKPGINGTLISYELWLYNRYGQLLFKTSNPYQGWDGHFKNNKNTLPGGYIWMCKYQFVGKPIQHEQGSFTLIR